MMRWKGKMLQWAVSLAIGMQLHSVRAQVVTEVEWQRCIGGSGPEFPASLQPASDGGCICIGTTPSSDGDAAGFHGVQDILVAKLDADGVVQWSRALGGSGMDLSGACLEASDGSIMVTGIVQSDDGDVSGNHGATDVWVVKLSPLGDIVWQRAYGGSGADSGGAILETVDGGFVVVGQTTSNDGDVAGYHGGGDVWVFKIDPSGQLLWSTALGGSGNERGTGYQIRTADGGFLLVNRTTSNDGDVSNHHGNGDAWLVKVNASGGLEWSLAVGGSELDVGFNVLELSNGDILWLGTTASSDGDMPVNRGGTDVFLAKISANGQLLWLRTYGGSQNDDCRSLYLMPDGGFIIGGGSNSNDGDLSANHGGMDVWVLKVDANGALLWQRSFGGSMDDWANLYELSQGGYLLSGYTDSSDGDMQDNHGSRDLWFAKLTASGDLTWKRCIGGLAEDWGYLEVQTPDGGLVASGYTDSNDGDVSGNHGERDMWVVKLKVIEAVQPPECALFLPNAFSPDNSTKNDAYCLYGTDCIATMQLGIYDRWGNQVFSSTDPKACWDGTYNGQPLDPAVFVYHLSATLRNGESVERQGNITLMR